MSVLGQQAAEYVAIRRSLGFKLADHGRLLARFAEYLDGQGETVITIDQAVSWAQSSTHASPVRERQRLTVVRGFAEYLQAIDPRTQVPSKDLLPVPYRRRAPYLYGLAEVAALMAAARSMMPALKAATYETLIGVLAATGMRFGEAAGLDRHDVDLAGQILVIRCGKNGKSRQIPIHSSTVRSLAVYGEQRDQLCPHPNSSSFLVTTTGSRLARSSVHRIFASLRRRAGLEGRGGHRPPRVHDLRHYADGWVMRPAVAPGAAELVLQST